jgi:hypothetical protein
LSIAQPVAPLVVAHPSSHIHRVVVVVAVAVVASPLSLSLSPSLLSLPSTAALMVVQWWWWWWWWWLIERGSRFWFV